MGGTAISARNVSKHYRVAKNRDTSVTAVEAALARVRHPLRRTEFEQFRALEDVNFDIPFGEAVGIVGRNGAGKSTLLKILTRITAPTTGRVELVGRVGSLLEVGTGFHPELTGRENVFLNGTILGMRRREIQRQFDEIVDFAGVERFLDTQVKRYSTGMYIRLAFAVAAHLESEILAVDEVLAVGDADFQRKCLAKMRSVAQDGRTVLFVSHQIATVRELCTSALYLDRGHCLATTDVEDALARYSESFSRPPEPTQAARRWGSGEIRLASVAPAKEIYEPNEPKEICFQLPANQDWPGGYFVSAHILDENGVIVAQCDSRLMNFWLDAAKPVEASLTITSPWLRPGRYTVDVFVCRAGVIDAWDGACSFQVIPVLPYPNTSSTDGIENGTVFAEFEYQEW